MVRLADLPEWDRRNKLDKLKELSGFDARPWVKPPPLKQCRIAIVTTAGVHRKGDRPFGPGATDYRIIPGDTKAADLVMSHQSVNFDRTGFQEDHNVAFPIDRLNELARARLDRRRSRISIIRSWARRRSASSSRRRANSRNC